MQTKHPIGERISSIRTLKNINAEDFASKAGLSTGQLELIENGVSIPSLGVLIRISRALGVRLGTLIDDNAKDGPAIVKEKDRKLAYSFSTSEDKSREHLTFFSLASSKAGRHMEPFIVDIIPGESRNCQHCNWKLKWQISIYKRCCHS